MATFEDVVKQLQMNNRSEAGRDSRHTKMLGELKKLGGQTVKGNSKTNQAIKDASTKQTATTQSFGDDQKKEIIKSRKEATAKNKELQSLTGKNTKLMKDQEKGDAKFRKQLIDVELQDPDLNPTQRKELEKERAALSAGSLKGAFKGLKEAFSDFASPLKKFLGAKTGIPGITVGRFALLAAIPLLIRFLRSQAFQDMINYIKGPGGEVLNQVGAGLKFMLEKIGAFIVSIGSFSKSIQKFMEDPSFESFLGIFSENGTFFVGITALTALLAPGLLFGAMKLGIKAFSGALKFAGRRMGFLSKGLAAASGAQLLADGTIKDNNKDKDKKDKKEKDKTKDKTKKVTTKTDTKVTPKTETETKKTDKPKKVDPKTDTKVTPKAETDTKIDKNATKNVTKNTLKKSVTTAGKTGLKVIAGAARFAGPVGLALTAGFSLFEGIKAGVEEYRESGDFKSAVKQSAGGVVESLTFGLVNKDTVADALGGSGGGGNPLPESYKGYSDMGAEMGAKAKGMHSGGFLARGQLAMVGERGAELVMTNSPAQVMSAARTEQIEMAAANKTMNGGGGMGSNVFVNTGGNTATNVTRNTSFRPSAHIDTNFDKYQKFA